MPRTEIKTLALPLADIPRVGLVMGIFLGLLATLLQIGCARQSTVHAESREISLTKGDGKNLRPCFSPDGKYVAYAAYGEGVRIVPAGGGESSKILKETAELPLIWTGEDELLVWSPESPELRWIDRAGNVLRSENAPGKRIYFRDVTEDRKQFLWCDFSGTGVNLGIISNGGSDLKLLADTPEWEVRGCFGPDPGEVTLVRNPAMSFAGGDILIWSSEDRTTTPMTIPKGINNHPAWSPDRRYLAYTSDNSGNRELWVYDRESDKAVQLTSTPGEEEFPRWSPDGEWLTFQRVNRPSHIFVYDIQTQETTQLTKGEGVDRGPVLSEDGEWVAYIRRNPPTAASKAQSVLCITSISDGKTRTLDLGGLKLQSGDWGRWMLSWSPDATEVAFAADDRTGNVDIYRISREGGPPRRVTLSPGTDIAPCWSPDGSTIAYRRGPEGDSQIWAIPATGGIPKKLTSTEGVPLSFAWGADSDQLAYALASSLMSLELRVTSYRAPERDRRILEAHEGSYPFAWSADNKEILVVRPGKKSMPLFTVSAGTSRAVRFGEMKESDEGYVPVLSENAERFKSEVFPGGIFAYDHSKERSNIYSLHVPELIEARLTASGEWN